MDSNCKLNIFHLSSSLERIVPVKMQVVLGLGGTLFGAIYCGMFYARNHIFIRTALRIANVFLLFIAYLFMLKIYTYKTTDVFIFLLAIHGRALKSIIAETDKARASRQDEMRIIENINKIEKIKKIGIKKERSNFLNVFFVPKISRKLITFDKTVEEIIFRLLVLSNAHIIYSLPFSSYSILGKGILYAGISYGVRYTEAVITKKTRPGYLNADGYSIYVWFLYALFISELYTA